jgi:hypothetical protein
MFEQLSQLPVVWANNLTMALFILIALACFVIPFHSVIADAPDQRRWRDLRLWAVLLISLQLGIYLIFQ